MRYCKNCGLLAPHDASVCPQCGTPLPPAAPAGNSAAPATPPTAQYAPQAAPVVPALSGGATLVALLLFSIPFVGFILSLAWSFGFTKNLARKRLAQAWLIRTLVVAVVVGLLFLWLAITSVLTLSAVPYYYAY